MTFDHEFYVHTEDKVVCFKPLCGGLYCWDPKEEQNLEVNLVSTVAENMKEFTSQQSSKSKESKRVVSCSDDTQYSRLQEYDSQSAD